MTHTITSVKHIVHPKKWKLVASSECKHEKGEDKKVNPEVTSLELDLLNVPSDESSNQCEIHKRGKVCVDRSRDCNCHEAEVRA